MVPNVLLVVLDTARRDALAPYGAPAAATPAIAQLASRGVAMAQAYATSSWTLPSHASIFTGLLPRRVGVAQPPDGTPQSARPRFEAMAERMLGQVMRDHGYATHAWTTNVWVSPSTGFDIGFDSFEYVCSGREERMNALLGKGPAARLAWALEGLRSRSDDGAAEVGARLRRAIAEWSGQPTLWFVNLSECHSPYLPPRPWNDLPALERVRAAFDARQHLNFEAICLYVAGRHAIPAAGMQRMRHLYERAIASMDRWLGDVLEALDHKRILEETLVIVTSDHGENFGEEGLIAHGFSLDQRMVHVPLVLAGPGTPSAERPLSLAEIPSLIATAAGLDSHPYSDPRPAAPVAVSQFDPMTGPDDQRMVRFAEKWDLDESGVERLSARISAATDGSTKLVVRDGRETWYDLTADPEAFHPLDPSRADERLVPLRAALDDAALEEETFAVRAGAAGAHEAVLPTLEADEVADLERRMKLLGYM